MRIEAPPLLEKLVGVRRKGYVQGRVPNVNYVIVYFALRIFFLSAKSHTSFVGKEVGGEEATFMYVQMMFACCCFFVGAFALPCKLDFYKRCGTPLLHTWGN